MLTKTATTLACLAAALVAFGYVRGGRPQVIYTAGGEITDLVADETGLLWLERPVPSSPGGALYGLADGAGSPACLYAEPRLTSFVPAGDRVLAVTREGELGAVIALPRKGGAPSELVSGLRQPAGLGEHGGVVYFAEATPPLVEHLHHVPVLRSRTIVKGLPPEGGAPRALAAFEGPPSESRPEFLGGRAGKLYWLDRTSGGAGDCWTAVRSVDTEGGTLEVLTRERSAYQHAVLSADELLFTAPSEDAGDPLSYRCVRRLSLNGGDPTTQCDWLPPGGRIVRSRTDTYYTSFAGAWVWGESLSPPRKLDDGPYPVGTCLAEFEGRLYAAGPSEEGSALYFLPRTLLQRLQNAASRSHAG